MTATGTVYVLQYTHVHGQDLSAHATLQGAEKALAGIAREWWTRELDGIAGVPATPDDLSDNEAVRIYFGHLDDEDYQIHELDIDPQ